MSWSVLLINIAILFSSSVGMAQEVKRLEVVASNSIVADWVKNVAGEHVDMTILVGPNGDVHTFEPTPSHNVALSKADLIFEMGLGLEHWMDKLYTASGSRAKRVFLARGVVNEPLSVSRRYGIRHADDIDPHVWHNPRYTMGMVKHIQQVLISLDSTHKEAYESNTRNYLKQLQELDNWVIKTVSQLPRLKRKLVTNHDSLGYFCERYHFELIGTLFDSFTTEAEDPSARSMADLIFKIKQSGVHAVFAETMNNSKTLDSLAKEAQVKIAPPLYTDALGSEGSGADTYINMMRYNTETIVSALQ